MNANDARARNREVASEPFRRRDRTRKEVAGCRVGCSQILTGVQSDSRGRGRVKHSILFTIADPGVHDGRNAQRLLPFDSAPPPSLETADTTRAIVMRRPARGNG